MQTINMDLVGHLEELRKRLLITLGTFILFVILAFVFVQDIYKLLVKDLSVELAILGPSDILWIYLVLASVVAIAGTIPVAAHQTWLFIKPALKEHERKTALCYIPALFLLFLAGLSFGYFVIFPMVFQFLMGLSDDMFQNFFTAEKYFKFLIHMTLPFGFLFELPVVIMFLTSLGLLTPAFLKKVRKYAYFLLILTAVLITPPDFLSDVLVIIPLIFLYECSIVLSKFVTVRKNKLQHAA
ncbi:twin-arginine translocase subunit TatC [Bacillus massilinigeriensis]|uniref:twin-arginine translocase subunit TatC n=1 Tax=Bacillus mediterraneensis TaxID=1805474 RepID=UPI0008F91286|nr:twin-arginine translocase subunit TatC [Bacillus mediterraneensis]